MLNQLISSKELLLQQAVQEEEKRRQEEAARIAAERKRREEDMLAALLREQEQQRREAEQRAALEQKERERQAEEKKRMHLCSWHLTKHPISRALYSVQTEWQEHKKGTRAVGNGCPIFKIWRYTHEKNHSHFNDFTASLWLCNAIR